MKTIIVIFLVLFSSSVLFGQEHKERMAPTPRTGPPPAQPSQPSPLRYTSAEGRYTVSLAEQPTLSTQQISAPDGSPVTQYMAMAGDATTTMMIAYFDYSGDVVFNLDKARDGMVKSINGILVDEHSMSLGGAPGRQLKIAARTQQGLEFIDRARFYDVRPRVYVLQCLSQKSLDSEAIAEKCEQFFDSFRVRSTP